jgi:hypothetical protein
MEIEETSATYHTKTGETRGQIFLPYILLSHNAIFPHPRLDVSAKWQRRIAHN